MSNQGHSWILDSTSWDYGFQLLDSGSLSVEVGFWIPIVSGVPDSLTCIQDSIVQDSRFHKQTFHRFWNTEFPYMGQEYITLFPIFLKSKNLASHQFCYSRLCLSTETVSCRLLQRMEKRDIDWNLKNSSFNWLCQQKSPKQLLWPMLVDEICLIIYSSYL